MSPTAHTVIGIDPGTRSTGYAIVVKDNRRPLQARVEEIGVLRQLSNTSLPRRLARIASLVTELTHRHQPHAAAIEKAFFGINAASALKLGEARGAIITALSNILPEIKLIEVAPAQVKKLVAGNGNASKAQVATALSKMLRYNLDRVPDDASDALALAFCYHLTSLSPHPVHSASSAAAKHGSARLPSVGRPKRDRVPQSCVPVKGFAMLPRSDQSNGS